MSDHKLSRRAFVVGSAAAAVVAVDARSRAAGPPLPALASMSASDAVGHMTRGEVTAEQYAAVLLAQCEQHRDLNAFITLEPERVLENARNRDRERRDGKALGPLFGLPIPVKDSVNTLEYPTTAGTPALRQFRPGADAPVVAQLKSAGAVVLGKTNLHELSYGWTSNNLAFGAVHNPYDVSRIPGGSSGGTAAAVAARIAPLGIAEDTEGSIRVPAAFCGIAGFRPTTGRYSTEGCVPITRAFDQVGPHARTVGDLALFDAVITGDHRPLRPTRLRGVRLGVIRDYWFKDLDSEVERVTESALARLRDAGAVLVEGTLPDLARLISLTTSPVQNFDVALELDRYLKKYDAGITARQLIAAASSDIREVFRTDVWPGAPHAVSPAAYAAARSQYLPALRQLYRDYFARSQVAAVVFPTTLVPAPLIGEETSVKTAGNRDLPFEIAVARNIGPGSTAGLPGLVLPSGLTRGGLPVSLELDAPAAGDRRLLSLGLAVERALGSLPAPLLST